MTADIKIKRAKFIHKSTEVRETFSFADTVQVSKAVNIYCCDPCGSMLWDLFSEPAGQYYRCWNTGSKLAWSCPLNPWTTSPSISGWLYSRMMFVAQKKIGGDFHYWRTFVSKDIQWNATFWAPGTFKKLLTHCTAVNMQDGSL